MPARGWLDRLERIGNRLPEPLTLFAILCAIVLVASALAAWAGAAVVHPGTGQTVAAFNLLSAAGLRRVLTEAVQNFTQFPPLGTVLVVMLGVGVAERTGLLAAALHGLVRGVPPRLVTATLVFAGVNSSLAADAGVVVLPPLGALIYANLGRHPLAGLCAAFAGVSGGFSANLLVTALDPLLSGLTQTAARIVQPDAVVQPTCNYLFMVFSTFLLTFVGAWVSDRIVEPRLGKQPAPAATPVPEVDHLSSDARRGLWAAALTAVLFALLVAALALPEGAPLRAPDGGAKPFFDSLVTLLCLGFLAVGVAYGLGARTLRGERDVARMAGDSMASMGGYIALAFVAAQFIAWFNASNLGLILAVRGAGLLRDLGLGGVPLLVLFLLFCATLNLFIASASAKWAILAPVFVPMLMLAGIPPESTQAVYRVADSSTNLITPLMPYFPVLIVYARRFVPEAGFGTLLACMFPYSLAFLVLWGGVVLAWIGLGIPLGI